MGDADMRLLEDLEWRTQEYSALITDARRTSCGSGVLYYSGKGSMFFVFTCAHVLEALTDPIEVHFLLPIDRQKEDYRECCIFAGREQVVYSPIDEITETGNIKTHSVDAAVIYLKKDDALPLEATPYLIAEARKGDKVFSQGFPGGIKQGIPLLEIMDTTRGTVLHSLSDRREFTFREEDGYLDQGNRVYELEGFSGAPVWHGEEENFSVLGLLSSGEGETVYRGRVSSVKMGIIRSIMKNHFNILLETRIIGIPEEDVACGKTQLLYDGTTRLPQKQSMYDDWLGMQTEKVRAYIDDIKFQKAIAFAKETMLNERFDQCSLHMIKHHMQHLLYCFEACYLDDEYHILEEEMRQRGLLKGHDPLRWLTYNFGKKNYKETMEYAKKILGDGTDSENVRILAEVFYDLGRAYEENAAAEDTLGHMVDEHENLKLEITEPDEEALIYQMIGFVYGERYKQYTRSVRCLNRAYRIGSDYAVLESLACAYYFLAIQEATREDGTVDTERINRAALYKARECFLIILEKADELYLSAILKREGCVLFNTFFFLQDTYRIITIYPLMKKYGPLFGEIDQRDLELKYARTLCQGGKIDLSVFSALSEADKVLIDSLGAMNEMMRTFEFKNPAMLKRTQCLEKDMQRLIVAVENNIEKIDQRERMAVVAMLMNLYGWGRRIFGWNVTADMERHLVFIRAEGNEKAVTAFENFLFENSHTVEEAEAKVVESWKNNPSLELWLEILQFYKRNWMLEKADAMFRDLFENHAEYVKDEPEYAYRAYIDYIIQYRRDIKEALRFFSVHKNEMQDKNIRIFWEHELMLYTNSFNHPERFEEERISFVEEGLLLPQEYHRVALIAYMCNLNAKKAWEHYKADNEFFGILAQAKGSTYLTKEGAMFLIWQRKYPPHRETTWNGMLETKVNSVKDTYRRENWHVRVQAIKKKLGFDVNRCIAIDAWGLYMIAVEDKLDTLEQFDNVYITHSSVSRMLEEMCHYENRYLESVIAYLEILSNVKLQSPDFEHQLLVRERAEYYEPCSTVALALELGCPAVVGEPMLDNDMIVNFKNMIIRPCDYDLLK